MKYIATKRERERLIEISFYPFFIYGYLHTICISIIKEEYQFAYKLRLSFLNTHNS